MLLGDLTLLDRLASRQRRQCIQVSPDQRLPLLATPALNLLLESERVEDRLLRDLAALLLSVAAHDLIRKRRVHAATIAGTTAVLAGVFASNAVAATGFGQAFVRSLG